MHLLLLMVFHLTRSSNVISDLFTGYTVNLNASTTVNGTDTPANLTGTVDNSSAITKFTIFC